MNIIRFFYKFYITVLNVIHNIIKILKPNVEDRNIENDKYMEYIENNTQKLMKNLYLKQFKNDNINSSIYDKEQFKNMMKNIDNEEELVWKSRVLYESTPRIDGNTINIVMYYDLYKQAFVYFSDESYIPYNLLNAVACKYVRIFMCYDFFVDEHIVNENDIDFVSPLSKVFDTYDEKEKDKDKEKEKPSRKSNVFAKLKKQANTVKDKENSKPEKQYKKNKFIHMGKFRNFSFTKKQKIISNYNTINSELFTENTVQSYKEYKKLLNQSM